MVAKAAGSHLNKIKSKRENRVLDACRGGRSIAVAQRASMKIANRSIDIAAPVTAQQPNNQ